MGHVESLKKGNTKKKKKETLRIPGLAVEEKHGQWPISTNALKTQRFPVPLGNVFNDYCFHQQNGLGGTASLLNLQLKQR